MAIFIISSLKSKLLVDLTLSVEDKIDIVTIEVDFGNTKKIISAVYRAPDQNYSHFNDLLYCLFNKYINSELLICGDFNIDLSKSSNISKSFKDTLNQLGISQLIETYTRLTLTTCSIIDNILSNSTSIFKNGIIHTDISDHAILYIIFNSIKPKLDHQYINIRNKKKFNILIENIKNTCWNDIF